jgi:hypothetical protein
MTRRLLGLSSLIAAGMVMGCHGPKAVRPGAGTGSGGHFVDVTSSVAGSFRFNRVPSNIIESIGPGAAFIDIDGDGLLDVYLIG